MSGKIQYTVSEGLQYRTENLKKDLYDSIVFQKNANHPNSQNNELCNKYLHSIDNIHKTSIDILNNKPTDTNPLTYFPENTKQQVMEFYDALRLERDNVVLDIDKILLKQFIISNFHENPFTQIVIL